MASNPERDLLIHSLSDFLSGSLTVTVNKLPFAKINGETKSLDIELKGLNETGLRLGELVETGERKMGLIQTIRESNEIAKKLHDQGWKVSVFDGNESLVAIGRGVSSITGYMWMNPLKLSKIRKLT